jgi:hypothetical protein
MKLVSGTVFGYMVQLYGSAVLFSCIRQQKPRAGRGLSLEPVIRVERTTY